jgi:hypothetical protein
MIAIRCHPRIRILKGILAKIEPRATAAAAPVPAAKPDDRPRAALAAMERPRRG